MKLPRKEHEHREAQGGQIIPQDPTVLLVDDDDAVRGFAELALSSSGYRVFACSGGEQALRRANEHRGPIHLLLTDIVMPGMTGTELVKVMAERRPGIKALLISGCASENTPGAIASRKAFLAKPFTVEQLLSAVRDALSGPGGGTARPAGMRDWKMFGGIFSGIHLL
jgi:DNA-binding NtrC family response regulator